MLLVNIVVDFVIVAIVVDIVIVVINVITIVMIVIVLNVIVVITVFAIVIVVTTVTVIIAVRNPVISPKPFSRQPTFAVHCVNYKSFSSCEHNACPMGGHGGAETISEANI